MKHQRSVVNMQAVAAPNAKQARGRAKDVALVASLIIGVTVGGVALGVYGVSPVLGRLSLERAQAMMVVATAYLRDTVESLSRQPNVLAVLGITLFAAIATYVGIGIWRKSTVRRAATSMTQTSMSFTARTPRDVQVLAAAGKAPADIAARTRLPVDAVSMLLNLGQSVPRASH